MQDLVDCVGPNRCQQPMLNSYFGHSLYWQDTAQCTLNGDQNHLAKLRAATRMCSVVFVGRHWKVNRQPNCNGSLKNCPGCPTAGTNFITGQLSTSEFRWDDSRLSHSGAPFVNREQIT